MHGRLRDRDLEGFKRRTSTAAEQIDAKH
jgi:hypothetical protein